MIKYLVLALILALTACGHKDSPVAPVTPEAPGVAYRAPGIRLTQNGRLAKMVALDAPSIYLGSFKMSDRVLFTIQNTGSVPLYNLKITTNHPNFSITPDSIHVLGVPGDTSTVPCDSSSDSTSDSLCLENSVPLIPIIQVRVGHGTPIVSKNNESLLWDGISLGSELTTADIQFTWEADTSENADTTAPTSVSYPMTARAEVAAVGPDRVVAGSDHCFLRVISPESRKGDTLNVGDTLPTEATNVFSIPNGCIHGAGIRQESDTVYTLSF